MPDDLIERAHTRAREVSSSVGKSNLGIDLELLAAMLIELRAISGRKPRPVDVPRSLFQLLSRFKKWIIYK